MNCDHLDRIQNENEKWVFWQQIKWLAAEYGDAKCKQRERIRLPAVDNKNVLLPIGSKSRGWWRVFSPWRQVSVIFDAPLKSALQFVIPIYVTNYFWNHLRNRKIPSMSGFLGFYFLNSRSDTAEGQHQLVVTLIIHIKLKTNLNWN